MGAGWSPTPIEPERGLLWRYLAPPYRRFDIDTHLTVDQCKHALGAIVERRRWFRRRVETHTDHFEGKVTGSGFSINRIFRGQNSFVPMISGVFGAHPGGTRVSVTMRLHWFVLCFWVIWETAVFAGVAATLLAARERFTSQLVPLAIMLALGYLLCTIVFEIEAVKARRLLTEALTGPRTPTPS